jgi:hypothetical protein
MKQLSLTDSTAELIRSLPTLPKERLLVLWRKNFGKPAGSIRAELMIPILENACAKISEVKKLHKRPKGKMDQKATLTTARHVGVQMDLREPCCRELCHHLDF